MSNHLTWMAMSDLFDTSRVPDDTVYWDALAARVATNALSQSRAGGLVRVAQSRAGWVSASLALAAALAFMLLPGGRNESLGDFSEALVPTDDVARAIIVSEAPPAIEALLLPAPGAIVR
jgi:hypothetical protein